MFDLRSVLKAAVRQRLSDGWSVWIGPDRRTVWARMGDRRGRHLETRVIAAGELEVLDEVLQETAR